jgi:hypothetical protein
MAEDLSLSPVGFGAFSTMVVSAMVALGGSE